MAVRVRWQWRGYRTWMIFYLVKCMKFLVTVCNYKRLDALICCTAALRVHFPWLLTRSVVPAVFQRYMYMYVYWFVVVTFSPYEPVTKRRERNNLHIFFYSRRAHYNRKWVLVVILPWRHCCWNTNISDRVFPFHQHGLIYWGFLCVCSIVCLVWQQTFSSINTFVFLFSRLRTMTI